MMPPYVIWQIFEFTICHGYGAIFLLNYTESWLGLLADAQHTALQRNKLCLDYIDIHQNPRSRLFSMILWRSGSMSA